MNRVVAYVDGFNLYFGFKEGTADDITGLTCRHLSPTCYSPTSSCTPSGTSRRAYVTTRRQAPGSPPTLMRWRVTAPWSA